MIIDENTMLEFLLYTATNRKKMEQHLLNKFDVEMLEDIPADELLRYCKKNCYL